MRQVFMNNTEFNWEGKTEVRGESAILCRIIEHRLHIEVTGIEPWFLGWEAGDMPGVA
jgi:hypothetical protein